MRVQFGIGLGALHPGFFLDASLEAEKLGYESVWLPEHLVFPVDMTGSPFPGADHPPVPATTPVFDVFAYLSFLAGRTHKLRLGTHVYLLGLRHPFVAARAIQTLDVVSEGRAEIGIGSGWLRQEWVAAGLDPGTRGRRLDEALAVCKRLWSEEVVAHDGAFYSFEPVAFEPKPQQRPHPPIHVGGESDAALRRAARDGNGWLGLHHTPDSARPLIDALTALRRDYGREQEDFACIVGANPADRDEVRRFEDVGVTRIIATPWQRSRQALDGMRRLADRLFD